MKAKLHYYVVFGKCDATDWFEWETELTEEEEKYYKEAIEKNIPFDEVYELSDVLDRAYNEIEAVESQNLAEAEDEYYEECSGTETVDPDEINDLVADRDQHTLEFFDLEDLSDEELDEWDANDLDELPQIKDFDEDFEESSPFDEGWELVVKFDDLSRK